MKNVVIFANCQGEALGKTLLENDEFAAAYQWQSIPPVQQIESSFVPALIDIVQNADLLIYQSVKLSPRRPEELATQFLKNQLKDSAVAVSIPSLYFDGYFPHLQSLAGVVSVLNLVHDYFIAYAYVVGIKPEQLSRLLQKEGLYTEKLSTDLANQSLQSLRKREAEASLDIRASDFIEKNYQREKLFNQFNHPKRAVLRYIGESILSEIGITQNAISEVGPSYLDGISTPIYPSTHKNLKLEFDEDFKRYSAPGGKVVDQGQIVQRFFDFYEKQNLVQMKNQIIKAVITYKPFIPELIEANI